jgi:hypothetical protein
MLYKRYRKDYTGEFLIFNVSLDDGTYEESREWIPNNIQNNDHYGTAVVLGNGTSRGTVALPSIKNHRTGIGGVNRMQSYGCNALYRDFAPDFLIVTNTPVIREIAEKKTSDTIVLTTGNNILHYPGKFHMVPYGVSMNAGAIAAYMACFDGHKHVYLLGFDNQTGATNNNIYAGTKNYDGADTKVSSVKWEHAMLSVFKTFPEVSFIRVEARGETIKSWKSCLNYSWINARQFALAVDL